MPRVWGGRNLATVLQRQLPGPGPWGESWEVCDRLSEQSIVSSGEWAGCSLHDLWGRNREKIFGDNLKGDRFPLLIKILDAEADLSIQVHPPEQVASLLGGSPKTEMWYIARALPGSKLFVGLREGVTRAQFENAIRGGSVENMIHAVEPQAGQSIFIPSGRLHAIGSGLLIYEIQQNSDTTYRVFDWNRTGLDGKARDLHLRESLASIDFTDYEPGMDQPKGQNLATCSHFKVDCLGLPAESRVCNPDPDRFSIITLTSGRVRDTNGATYSPGDSLLLPRGASEVQIIEEATLLQTTLPR
ncbi:MAG TPA: mannose-6-phosphate isomerase [Verrucomicrobiales bacterium]|nr:mannose-6-phosphate isomerase [Roseibacillus sp.]HCQ33540.1 mannose-6-phosphate isomerase [Verrucomicrobiales bacterium]